MDENTRFRRALKNPLVMASLCILAGIAVYHNVIEGTMESPLPGSVASMPDPGTPVSVTSTPSSMAHDDIAIQRIQHPARDPFAPMSVVKQSMPSSRPSRVSVSSPSKRHPRSPRTLLLKAVAIEAQQRSAVINRQVVYEGEMIEGYRVVSIQLKGVWLKRHGRKEFLSFAPNTTS